VSNESKKALLEAGAKLASKHGAKNVTRRMVAKAAHVSESLVSHYMGATAVAQKKYAAHAKKIGLALPAKDAEAKLGKSLRKKTAKKAPAKKVAAKKATRVSAKKATKKVAAKKAARKNAIASDATPRRRSVKEIKAIKDKAAGKRPSAARAPKPAPVVEALPPLPALPADTTAAALPPLPDNLVGSIR
jgi:hypothetical protein